MHSTLILSVHGSASLDGTTLTENASQAWKGFLQQEVQLPLGSCYSNRKFPLNCGALACLPRPRNRVYSLLGRLLAFDSLLYISRALLPNRTVLPCLTAVTAYWPLPPTRSNTWRRS